MMNVIILTHVELKKVCAIAFAYFFSIRNYSKIFSYKRTKPKKCILQIDLFIGFFSLTHCPKPLAFQGYEISSHLGYLLDI